MNCSKAGRNIPTPTGTASIHNCKIVRDKYIIEKAQVSITLVILKTCLSFLDKFLSADSTGLNRIRQIIDATTKKEHVA